MTIKHTSYEIEPLPNNPSHFESPSLPLDSIEPTFLPNQAASTTSMVEEEFNIDTAINSFYKSAVEFIVGLHDNNNFTKKDVSNIQSGIIQSLLTPMVSILKNVVKSEVKEPLSLSKFDNILTAMSNPFQFCTSEYILLKWLVANDLISKVKQFTIHNEIRPVQNLGETVYDEKQTKGALLPLKLQFKKYFEHGHNFQNQLNKLKKLQLSSENNITNFVQGKLWKLKICNHSSDKILIPYFLYIDDAEINNPLGSHAMFQQISAIYYSFPLAENSSKLSNIFLSGLIKSLDLKEFGNDLCLQTLICEINCLENDGLDIVTECGSFHVHFIPRRV